MRRWSSFLVAFAVIVIGPVVGAGAPVALWTTVDASGSVRSRPAYELDDHWSRVRKGDVLQPLTTIRTGRRGRAVLATTRSRLEIGPRTEVELPAPVSDGTTTEILHSSGTVGYDLHAARSRIEVLTPLVIVGSVGAVFAVDLDGKTATVTVRAGSVGVVSRVDGSSVTLAQGDVALVDVERGGEPEVHRRVAGATRLALSSVWQP